MTDNSPVSFADSPLYTRGANYEFPRQCSHWLGMTELVAFHLAAAAQWLSTSLSKSTHWSSVSSPAWVMTVSSLSLIHISEPTRPY